MRHAKKSFARIDRVAQQMHRELAALIQDGVKDPRCFGVTVTGVEVARDYSRAKVYYTALAKEEQREGIQQALERAKGFLRSALAARLSIFKTPELVFVYDESVERGMRIEALIDKVSKEPPVED